MHVSGWWGLTIQHRHSSYLKVAEAAKRAACSEMSNHFRAKLAFILHFSVLYSRRVFGLLQEAGEEHD
jgi:hypothetical protein